MCILMKERFWKGTTLIFYVLIIWKTFLIDTFLKKSISVGLCTTLSTKLQRASFAAEKKMCRRLVWNPFDFPPHKKTPTTLHKSHCIWELWSNAGKCHMFSLVYSCFKIITLPTHKSIAWSVMCRSPTLQNFQTGGDAWMWQQTCWCGCLKSWRKEVADG